jgi:hypothetical protein
MIIPSVNYDVVSRAGTVSQRLMRRLGANDATDVLVHSALHCCGGKQFEGALSTYQKSFGFV